MFTDQTDTANTDATFIEDTCLLYGLRVHQATGMVAVQADCPIPEAFALIRDQAAEDGCSIERTARDVIERRLRFD
ncbi:MAG TPA: ANTAR domain-containing protein [Acidimicrobiales bacterium]|nr:ANTAR domain-containing protein [Acidimicrobiales bacterium]